MKKALRGETAAAPLKQTRQTDGDVLEYIGRREAADPALARLVDEEFNRLRLARQIKAIREALQLSQRQLAERVGTRQPAIARLESGRVLPRLDLLSKIAAAMGMQVEVRLTPAPPKPPRCAARSR